MHHPASWLASFSMLATTLLAQTGRDVHHIHDTNGEAPAVGLGVSVALVGDCDRDGIADVIAGGVDYGKNGVRSGGAVLISGRTNSPMRTYYGNAAEAAFGASVAGIGDVDGDGVPDYAIGAPGRLPESVGYVTVCSGSTGATLWSVRSVTPGDGFGSALAGDIDLNADGAPDVLVGAPSFGSAPGKVQAFDVRNGKLLFTKGVIRSNDAFGFAVAAVGDTDCDGVEDFVVGAPSDDPGGRKGAGRAYLFSGATWLLLHEWGGTAGLEFGVAVNGAGDVDGDGCADVLVGGSMPATGKGVICVYSGKSHTCLQTLSTGKPDYLGRFVGPSRDFDADGVPDVVAGAVWYPDQQTARGRALIFSVATGQIIRSYEGAAGGDFFGYAPIPIGDINEDGIQDLAAGSPGADHAGMDSGTVEFLSFQPLGLSADSRYVPQSGGKQRLFLHEPAQANRTYLMLGSLSGRRPGIQLPGLSIPLVFDAYTSLGTCYTVAPCFGLLDGNGNGQAIVSLPPGLPAGLVLYHAYVTFDLNAGRLFYASNAVTLAIE